MAKRIAKKSKEIAASESEIIREITSHLMTMPEINEAFTQADLELALEDRDWIGGLGGQASEKWNSDLQPQQRRLLIERSRMYWMRDPLAHQAVRLWTDYCFGVDGLSYESEDERTVKNIDSFVQDPQNRNYFTAQGWKRLSNKLLVDGDLFLASFEDETLRAIDALQMSLLKDPDDEDIVLGYKRESRDGKKRYYLDWAYQDRASDLYDPDVRKTVKPERQVLMYRVTYDPLGHYGNGLLNTSTSWSSSHRRFMQARVNLLEALSKIAYRLTVKGGTAAVANAKAKLQSSLADGGTANGVERNPPATSGSTYIGNDGAKLDQMPRATGAGDARSDSDNLKLMVAAGTGIFLHYFGDPSTGNLATATAMELPMMKQFGAYQKLWKDSARDVFAVMLRKDPRELAITCNLPPLLEVDLAKLGAYITQLTNVFPETKIEPVLRECLISLGIENVDDVLKAAAKQRKVIDAQNEFNNNVAAAGVGLDPASMKAKDKKDNPSDQKPAPGSDYTESLTKLSESVRKLTELL